MAFSQLFSKSYSESTPSREGSKTPTKTSVSEPLETESDDGIPLTAKQRYLLVANWRGIARAVSTAGATMFVKMLSENEELYGLFAFRNIAGAPKEDQLHDGGLRSHSEGVMRLLGQAICNVNDSATLFSILDKCGISHARKNHFKPSMFWMMEQPFLYAVKLVLAERYSENMDKIYKVIIRLIITRVYDAACRERLVMEEENKAASGGNGAHDYEDTVSESDVTVLAAKTEKRSMSCCLRDPA